MTAILYLYILVLYLALVFVSSRLIIPHLGFKAEKIPEKIPSGMAEKIKELSSQAGSAEEFLRLTYEFFGKKYHTSRLKTITRFFYLFKSVPQAWRMSGFLPCTVINYLFKIFLVKSGRFKEAEVRRRHIFMNFIVHQYLEVKLNGRWLSVDAGERQRQMPLGQHAGWFG